MAGRLGIPFVELNREIEKEASLEINEIVRALLGLLPHTKQAALAGSVAP